MSCVFRHSVGSLAAAVLLAGAAFAFGEISSQTHPRLEKIFKQHADADRDQDGVLSYLEYKQLFEKKNKDKRSRGQSHGPIPVVQANGDMPITDFEESSFSRMSQLGWKIEGNVFRNGPSTATRIMKKRVGSYSGKNLLSTLVGGDREVGKMLSPLFDVELEYLEFLISGGKWPGTSAALVGTTIRATS